MTWYPDEIENNLRWKQRDIVLWIMSENVGVTFDVVDIQQHMIALGYPPRKYKKATLQTVMAKLAREGKIIKSERGEYYVEEKTNEIVQQEKTTTTET